MRDRDDDRYEIANVPIMDARTVLTVDDQDPYNGTAYRTASHYFFSPFPHQQSLSPETAFFGVYAWRRMCS